MPRVPVLGEPTLDLPPDLGVVVRVDLERLSHALPQVMFQAGVGAVLSGLGAETFGPAVAETKYLYLGMRPVPLRGSAPHVASDYVLVLDGTSGNIDRSWTAHFHPPRDMGGSFLRHDARRDEYRFAPGRVYEKVGRRLTIASAAEVDALELIIERQVRQRSVVPEARGVVSLVIEPAAIVERVREGSPRFASLLERARVIFAFADVNQEHCSATVRVRFGLASEAERVQTALRLVLQLLDTPDRAVHIDMSVVEEDLILSTRVQLTWLQELLGLRATSG